MQEERFCQLLCWIVWIVCTRELEDYLKSHLISHLICAVLKPWSNLLQSQFDASGIQNYIQQNPGKAAFTVSAATLENLCNATWKSKHVILYIIWN